MDCRILRILSRVFQIVSHGVPPICNEEVLLEMRIILEKQKKHNKKKEKHKRIGMGENNAAYCVRVRFLQASETLTNSKLRGSSTGTTQNIN